MLSRDIRALNPAFGEPRHQVNACAAAHRQYDMWPDAMYGVSVSEGSSMDRSSAFWAAFWTGLASATCLYAPPAPYWAFLAIPGPAQSLAAVGARLTQAVGTCQDRRLTSAVGD